MAVGISPLKDRSWTLKSDFTYYIIPVNVKFGNEMITKLIHVNKILK